MKKNRIILRMVCCGVQSVHAVRYVNFEHVFDHIKSRKAQFGWLAVVSSRAESCHRCWV